MFGKLNGAAREHVDVSLDRLSEIVHLARACEPDLPSRAGETPAASDVNAPARDLRRAIDALLEDERAVLLALALIGRGDFSTRDFDMALTQAFDRDTGAIADALLGIPALGETLEQGAIACGADFSSVSNSPASRLNGRLH